MELEDTYDKNRREYLSEIKETQNSVYNDVMAYSKVNLIMTFETLDIFLDSYSLIFNQTLPNCKLKERDKKILDKLSAVYLLKLAEYNS